MPTHGKLNVEIGANTTPMTAGLQRAASELRSFLTLGALASAARQAIAFGSAMNDTAAKAGVAVKWLQATSYAAQQAGSSLDELANSLVELRRAQAQALQGSGADLEAFSQLGIGRGDLASMSTEGLFDRIADVVQRSNGGIQEVNAALQVLGRGGKGLLTGLVEGFSDARAEAYQLGLVLEESTIKALDELGDRLDTAKLKLTAFTAVVLKNLTDEKTAKSWDSLGRLISPADTLKAIWKGGPEGMEREIIRSKLGAVSDLMELVEEYEAEQTGTDNSKGKSGGIPGFGFAKGKRQRAAVSDLARIGGYMSGAGVGGNPLLRVQNQALVELRQMRSVLTRIANRQPGESITW